MTTTIDNERKIFNVPNLRFPEFEGEWEKCKLGDVCNTSTGNKNTQDKTDDGIYPFYVRSQTVERINSWTFDGEAILTAGDGVGVGKVFHHTYGKIGVHQRVYILSNFKCDANYLFHFFSSKFYNRVKRMSAKNSVDSVRKEMITDMPLSLPCCQEQVKIGYILSILDERISTQNKIIEELKQLKNGISLNLFTNRIIFDKQITLSKCGTLRNGYAFKSSTYNLKGKYSIITIANVTGSRFIESVDCNKVTQIPEDIQSHQILSNGDILISLTGNVGRVSLCTDGHFLLNQRVGLFELSDSIDKEFIYQVLSSKHFENEMIAKGQGAAQMNINKNDVESYVIPYSTNLQNIRIVSSLLKSLDEKILTMEHLLLSYNKQKTYLLRQMFI